MNKVLVTGFESFGRGQRQNRSGELVLPEVKKKYGGLVETFVLPVAHDVAAEQMAGIIKEVDPAAVVMFGVTAGRKVGFEEVAKNRRLSLLFPDNNHVRKIGRIDAHGPRKLESTLPIDDLYERLDAAGIPTKISSDAGAFVCNEVMYRALQETQARQGEVIPTGFIHLGNGLSDQLTMEAANLVVDEMIARS